MVRKIYGVSSKYEFGAWNHVVYSFTNKATAERWLETEEHDFRERELMTKKAAIKLAGAKAVNIAKEIPNGYYYKKSFGLLGG